MYVFPNPVTFIAIASRFFLFMHLVSGDFKRCAGSSPFCLGMVDLDCCGVENKLDNQR